MKKINFLAILASFLMFSSAAFAFEPIWRSSNTQTADTAGNLCPGVSYLVGTSTISAGGKGLLHGVCVNTPSTSGSFSVWSSSVGASSSVGVSTYTILNTNVVTPCMFYDVESSSGLYYTNTSTANVSILFACY